MKLDGDFIRIITKENILAYMYKFFKAELLSSFCLNMDTGAFNDLAKRHKNAWIQTYVLEEAHSAAHRDIKAVKSSTNIYL